MLYISQNSLNLAPHLLKGSFLTPLEQFLKQFKPKKYQAHSSYIIITAVYNTQKYLDTFFKSLIKQRLDFKTNIKLICVDDGSTDSSAAIIKAYKAKFPQNIIYLYKTNNGQASARNLGLDYLKEHPELKAKWLSFIDSDDFLDRDYFYEVDSFLKGCKDDLAMISCKMIFYREKMFVRYKDTNPLNYKFKNKQSLINIAQLSGFIQLSASSAFINTDKMPQNLRFDEALKPNFEDAKFINEFLLENMSSKAVFLKNAKYFYRKRADKSSTMDNKEESKLKQVLRMGYLLLLLLLAEKKFGFIPLFIQNVVQYHLFWEIKLIVETKMNFSLEQNKEMLRLFDEIFAFIDEKSILEYDFLEQYSFFYKLGILSCFKKLFTHQMLFIKDFDERKNEILFSFLSADEKSEPSFYFDEKEVKPSFSKLVQYDFLGRVFIYEKRIWVKCPLNALNFEAFLGKEQLFINFKNRHFVSLNANLFHKEFQILKTKRAKNAQIWLFADRILKADDNAEHLYRYLLKKHPEKRAYFVLSKASKDYQRLKNEGFKMLSPTSLLFLLLLFKADKIISSHIDRYFYGAFGKDTLKTKDFIFLQHGITKDDISTWLNERKINLLTCATKDEFNSIVKNPSPYQLSQKEVKFTGFARHDALLLGKKTKRQILIMPTWRKNITGQFSKKLGKRRLNEGFFKSLYFKRWSEFLQSLELKNLCQKHKYTVIFNPHQDIKPYISGFNLPSYIKVLNQTSLQELFQTSALLITDFSSVGFEMAYLSKPVIYYQFDEKDFFETQWQKGYFDYEKNGFGPVVKTLKDLFYELENLLKNGAKPNKRALKNIKKTFKFKDAKCCERIYEAIIALDEA